MYRAVADQPLRALIYNRASADPTGRGLSVASQEAENRAWCTREGWDIVGAITDNDRSASRYATKEREGYDQVKKALAGDLFGRVDVLVYWESSRGTRDLESYVPLRAICAAYRVLLAYRGRVYDMTEGGDRFTTGLDVLVDERYAEEARDRTLRGHRTSVENRTPRGFAPYGYLHTFHEHTGRLTGQVPDPDTAPVVEQIVARVLNGDTLYEIAKSLNDAATPTPQQRLDRWKGRTVDRAGWSTSMIRNLLAKPSLMGIRTHKGAAVGRGTWDPIVAPDDWQRVRSILNSRSGTGHDRRVKALLSGIAECGPCGGWLRPMTNRGRATYVCAGTVQTAPKGHVSRGRDTLDAFVVETVVRRLARPGMLDALDGRRAEEREQSAATLREIAGLEAEIVEYVRSASARHGLARSAFEQVVDDLSAQVEAKRATLSLAAELPPLVRGLAGEDAERLWADLPLSRQRQVLRLLARVVVHRSSRPGQRGFDATTVEITWRGTGPVT